MPKGLCWPGHQPLHVLLCRHVCQPRGVVHGVEESEAAQSGGTGLRNLTCPLPALCPGWSWGLSYPRATSLTHSLCAPHVLSPDGVRPLSFQSKAEQQDPGSCGPRCPGHSTDMQSLWQAASGRPGQRTESGRRRAGSCTGRPRDKSQLE